MKKIIPLILVWACQQATPQLSTQELDSRADALLQAISIVDENVAWVSGHKSTFVRTVDGGKSWETFTHPEIDSLQFRDIHAIDQSRAVLMSAGPGALSQIFVFSDKNGWMQTYVMQHEEGFLNTIEFWNDRTGLAFGDSFSGELFILKTEDGGDTWERISPSKLPAAHQGEGGFAASGTCIATQPGGLAWIGTGAGGNARVLHTADFGKTWEAYESPMVKGEAAGITSIRMATPEVGITAGGDLAVTDAYTANTAYTKNSGKTWTLTGFPITKGAFYGSDVIEWDSKYLWIACGPNGMDYTYDFGKTWTNLDTANLWAVDLHENGFGYAAGRGGKLMRILIEN